MKLVATGLNSLGNVLDSREESRWIAVLLGPESGTEKLPKRFRRVNRRRKWHNR